MNPKLVFLLGLFLNTVCLAAPTAADKAWLDYSGRGYSDGKKLGELLIIHEFVKRWESYKNNPRTSGPVLKTAPPASGVPVNNPTAKGPMSAINPYHDIWRKNPSHALQQLNLTLNEYRTRAKALDNAADYRTAPRAFLFLREATSLLPKLYGTGAKGGLYGMEMILDDINGSRIQIELQNSAMRTLQLKSGMLNDILAAGKGDTLLRDQVLNPVMSPYSHVLMGETDQKMREHHREHLRKSVSDTDRKIAGAQGGELNALQSLRDLLRKQSELDSRLDDHLSGKSPLTTQEAQKLFTDLMYTSQHLGVMGFDSQREQSAQAQAAIAQLREDRAHAWSQMLAAGASLAAVVNADAARAISVVGSSLMDLNQTFERATRLIDQGGADRALGNLLKLAGMVNFVAGITSILGMMGPDMNALILAEIQALRKQLDNLRTEMHARFDVIDKKLNILYESVMEQFRHLDNQIIEVRLELNNVIIGISELRRKLDDIAMEMRYEFRAMGNQAFTKNVVDCVETANHYNVGLGSNELRVCLNSFYQCAVHDSSTTMEREKFTFEEAADKSLNGTQVYQNINYLTRVAEISGFKGLTSKDASGHGIDPESPKGPVNPAKWALCAHYYVRTALLYKKQYQALVLKDENQGGFPQIEAILNIGKRFETFSRRLSRSEKDNQEQIAAFRVLFKEYVKNLRQVADVLHEERLQMNGSETYRLFGFDPLLSSDQPIPNHNSSFARPTQMNIGWHGNDSKNLDLPKNLIQKLVPSVFFLGHQAGIRDVNIHFSQHRVYDNTEHWTVFVQVHDPSYNKNEYQMVAMYSFEMSKPDYLRHIQPLGGVVKGDKAFWEQVAVPLILKGQGLIPLTSLEQPQVKYHTKYKPFDRFFASYFKQIAENPKIHPTAIKVREHMAARHREIMAALAKKVLETEGKVRSSVRLMEGQRSLLEGTMTLAFPNSMAEDTRLRSLFHGSYRLPDQLYLAEGLAESKTAFLERPLPVLGGLLENSQNGNLREVKLAQGSEVALAQAQHLSGLRAFVGDYLGDPQLKSDLGIDNFDELVKPLAEGKPITDSASVALQLAALHKILFQELLSEKKSVELSHSYTEARLELELLSHVASEWRTGAGR